MGIIEAALGLVQYLILGIPRAKGTFSNPNFFALYLIATASLVSGMILGKKSHLPYVSRRFIGAGLLLIFFAVIISGSRGGSIVFFLLLFFHLYMRYGKRYLWVSLPLVALIMLIPNPIQQRLLHSDIGDNLRPQIWKISLQKMLEYPLGAGLGTYNYLSFQYDLPIEGAIARYGMKAGSAHNDYVQIGVELGIAGISVFLWGIFRLGIRVRRYLVTAERSDQREITLGITGGIMAILAHTIFDAIFHEPSLVILLASYAALYIIMEPGEKTVDETIIAPFPLRHPGLIVGLALIFALLIIRPAYAWYLSEKGNRTLEKGNIPHAIERFERAVIFDNGNAYHHDNLAYTYFMEFKLTNDYDWLNKAISELEYAASLNPLEGRFPAALGALYYQLALKTEDPVLRDNSMKKAIQYHHEAIQLQPFYPVRYNDLGHIYQTIKEYEIAARQFEKAIGIEPNFLPARKNLAMLYKETGRFQDALMELKKTLEIKERYKNFGLGSLEEQYLRIDEKMIREEIDSLLSLEIKNNLR